jgi:hypothetical protein
MKIVRMKTPIPFATKKYNDPHDAYQGSKVIE